jgi:hypothetical protein
LDYPLHRKGAESQPSARIPPGDSDNQTLHTKGYGILKVILLVYLLGHLFAQAGITMNHFSHALFGHDACCPCLME